MPPAAAMNSTNVRNSMRTMEERTMRTMILAAIGLAVLLAVVPQWARVEVAMFGIAFGVLSAFTAPAK